MSRSHIVRSISGDGFAQAVDVLVEAFQGDPMTQWLFRTDRSAVGIRRAFGSDLRASMRSGMALTTADGVGVALWQAPHKSGTNVRQVIEGLPLLPRMGLWRLPTLLAALKKAEQAHPTKPHWYLRAIGVVPSAQGQGAGAALIKPVLARCDESKVGAYLESSKERNLPLYQRLGFETIHTIDIPTGPRIWGMWRDPRGVDS